MQIKEQISTVSIVGSGNVATALGIALIGCGVKVIDVFSPNIINSTKLAAKIGSNHVYNIKKINLNSDLYIIAVPDKEIYSVSLELPKVTGVVVHTSGSEPISVLTNNNNYGVFYPLQTFTKDKIIDFKNIPICIEGSDNFIIKKLMQLAARVSENVVQLTSEQRQYLHLTAVTVNNFTNYLYGIAHDALVEKKINFSLLHPLIKETADKINVVNPIEAQTGPARRNDITTINKHMELLNKHPEYKKIYNLLSNLIIKKYHD